MHNTLQIFYALMSYFHIDPHSHWINILDSIDILKTKMPNENVWSLKSVLLSIFSVFTVFSLKLCYAARKLQCLVSY